MDTPALTAPEPALACAASDVPRDGTIVTRNINGRSIAIARRSADDDVIVAFDSRCPHMNGPLRFGRVADGEVICPWHFLRFDTTTGEAACCDKSIMKLKTYPVKLMDGMVYVQTGS
ncbi:MAG TPA: Rieske (2Fe-2S) protein [Ramlibacter sp.]|nr:Rieske (2Fe-2S) protein [Ramlibacter sp.]